ncbi:hypothetical protein A176_000793 [Myxococcus hansupus]|uniref:Lipoprotein n=1 Tax=Pseudomyxococcus hansupus TaxID=1297742 RepID=A0A0H4WKI5_9BACT|nr:hypothetical protein [Myxococcus hansupus]AKQ63881.1 hypothetical protein A176_000793 [Myxococcus hansupus]
MRHSTWKSLLRGGVFAALSGVVLMSAPVLARNTITTPAGCSQEFKGSKAQTKACRECVTSGGRFKKNVARKTWTCESKEGASIQTLSDDEALVSKAVAS